VILPKAMASHQASGGGLGGEVGSECEDRDGQARCFVVFGHSSRWSKATDQQLLDSVRQARGVHAGWRLRVYVDESVSGSVRAKLEALGAQLIDAGSMLPDSGQFTWAFWPFLAADDKDVWRFLVREAGFDVIERESPAVREWILSGRLLHVARDSSLHDRPFNPRAWGCVAPCSAGIVETLGGMTKAVLSFLEKHGAAIRTDFWFGDRVVWPSFASTDKALAHDSFSCASYACSLPFPTQRNGTGNVAQLSKSWSAISSDDVVDEAEESRQLNAIHFLEKEIAAEKPEWTCQRAPFACRRYFSWVQG